MSDDDGDTFGADRWFALAGVAVVAIVLIFFAADIAGWISDLVTPTIQDSVDNFITTTTTTVP